MKRACRGRRLHCDDRSPGRVVKRKSPGCRESAECGSGSRNAIAPPVRGRRSVRSSVTMFLPVIFTISASAGTVSLKLPSLSLVAVNSPAEERTVIVAPATTSLPPVVITPERVRCVCARAAICGQIYNRMANSRVKKGLIESSLMSFPPLFFYRFLFEVRIRRRRDRLRFADSTPWPSKRRPNEQPAQSIRRSHEIWIRATRGHSEVSFLSIQALRSVCDCMYGEVRGSVPLAPVNFSISGMVSQ